MLCSRLSTLRHGATTYASSLSRLFSNVCITHTGPGTQRPDVSFDYNKEVILGNNVDALLRIGFDEDSVASLVKTFKKLRIMDRTKDISDAAALLAEYGIRLASINNVRFFQSLAYIAKKNCVPLLDYLQNELNVKDLAMLLNKRPDCIYWKVSDLKEKVSVLESLLGLKVDGEFIKRNSTIFSLTADCVQQKVLATIDVLGEDTARIAVPKYPRIIVINKETMKVSYSFFQRVFGDARAHMILREQPLYLIVPPETRNRSTEEMIRVFGEENYMSMVTRCHRLTLISWDGNLAPKLNYALNTLGVDLNKLAKDPTYFTFSLTRRIQPRFKKLVEAGVDVNRPSLSSVLRHTDKKFEALLARSCAEREVADAQSENSSS